MPPYRQLYEPYLTPAKKSGNDCDNRIGQVLAYVIMGSIGFQRVADRVGPKRGCRWFAIPFFVRFFFTFLAPTVRIPLSKCTAHTHKQKSGSIFRYIDILSGTASNMWLHLFTFFQQFLVVCSGSCCHCKATPTAFETRQHRLDSFT